MFKRFMFVLFVLAVFALAFTVQAPAAIEAGIDGEVYVAGPSRVEYPCFSPKFETHRDTWVREDARIGARWANGCGGTEPQPLCPAGTAPLFAVPGTIYEGMLLANGAVVTNVKGGWVVEQQGDSVVAAFGRSMTITFPSETYVAGLLVFDNDPKPGQLGWSIDGVTIPATLRASWGPLFLLNSYERQLEFSNGGDSAHFNVCI